MPIDTTHESHAEPPFWLPLAAGLPIGLCMVVMALPALGNEHALAYRALYLIACLLWCLPLAVLQRSLWQRHTPWWRFALVLLAVSYAMSVANKALGEALAILTGWDPSPSFDWADLFSGLDGCWLALIAFCAIHAMVAYYAELKHEQVRRAEAMSLARDAELRALRYQLHPHFLFNTLNAISSLVANERNREASQMIARLGDFLRATLDGAESHEVALAEEIALTETYLAIEKARLGARLMVNWNVGPDVLKVPVPYLILQPLVENAIRHGIALRSQPGKLEIRIYRQGDRLRLQVRNDGMPLVSTDEARRSSMLGLRNVSERLARLYPGEHALQSHANEDGSYAVNIELPFREFAAPIRQRVVEA